MKTEPKFTLLGIDRPFNITYLGDNNFFVTIGKYNELILRHNYIYGYNGVLQYSSALEGGIGRGPRNYKSEPVTNLNTWANKSQGLKLKEFSEPIQITINLPSNGSIYLKIPKLMAGSNNFNFTQDIDSYVTPFNSIDDVGVYYKIAEIESEITSSVNTDDFIYIRDNDVYEIDSFASSSRIDPYPYTDNQYSYKGNFYIKLADIIYDQNQVPEIRYFWTSDVICPNRYSSANLRLWRALNIIVGVSVKYKNVERWEQYRLSYSRPDFMIKSISDIKTDKSEIAQDCESYLKAWILNDSLDLNSVKTREITAVYLKNKNAKPVLELWDSDTSDNGWSTTLIYDELERNYPNWFQ